MLHGKSQSPFSLFSFQDIITGLCGIMIFLVLVMLVDILTRRAAESVPVMDVSDTAALESEVARLEEMARHLLAEIRARRETAASDAPGEAKNAVATEIAEASERARAAESEGRKAEREAEAASAAKSAAEAEVRALEARASELEKRLEDLKRQNRITLIPEEGFRKKPVYAVLSAKEVTVLSPHIEGVRTHASTMAGLRTFMEEVSRLDSSEYCIVLLVRPDAFDFMEGVAAALRKSGFDVGRDPVGKDEEFEFGRGSVK